MSTKGTETENRKPKRDRDVMVELGRQSGPAAAAFKVVATPLVTLHVAANAKGLAAPGVRALEGLLARMRVAVDPERAGP